ncbi:MAG TPA: threonine synthase [Candidatus Polarisedimenticolia bacterium]|nr:threonine synthase [Candidatus Polarisedimenticolia bacterium]
MRYRSTSRKAPLTSLRGAVLRGLAPDGGLYMPVEIARHSPKELEEFRGLPFTEVCFRVVRPFATPDVPEEVLWQIVSEAINFPVKLVSLSPGLHILELFHGPTLAFKDFGARFMARLMGYFVRGETRPLTVLVATSGDTGSAVAHGFLNVPGIRVLILYPSKRVSEAQEKQFTTLGENITALEVAGTFDDCQRLVKQAFSDAELNRCAFLTSANSINIGRLLPQMFYHVAAYRQLPVASVPLIVSVPSGNFGNLTAGIFAKRIGLPVAKYVASTNANDVVPEYLLTGEFHPRAAKTTYANAMDVGNPNNFPRLLDLCRNRLEYVQKEIWGHGVTDEETLREMKAIHDRFGYIADPHTAVGVLGWEAFKLEHAEPAQGLVLATAHPAKFADVVMKAIGTAPPLPDRLATYLKREKLSLAISSSYAEFKQFLLAN